MDDAYKTGNKKMDQKIQAALAKERDRNNSKKIRDFRNRNKYHLTLYEKQNKYHVTDKDNRNT